MRYIVDGRYRRRPSALFGLRGVSIGVDYRDRLHPEPVLALALVIAFEGELVLGSLSDRRGDGYVLGAAEPSVRRPLEHVGDGVAAVRYCVPLERQRAGSVPLRDRLDGRRVRRIDVDNDRVEV